MRGTRWTVARAAAPIGSLRQILLHLQILWRETTAPRLRAGRDGRSVGGSTTIAGLWRSCARAIASTVGSMPVDCGVVICVRWLTRWTRCTRAPKSARTR